MADPAAETEAFKLLAEGVTAITARKTAVDRRRRYYDGDHPYVTAPNQADDTFKRFAVLGKANLVANIVDAVVDRMEIIGIRGADQAWETLQNNSFDAVAPAMFEEMAKVGHAGLMVWPGDEGPTVSGEDVTEFVVLYEPGSRMTRRAFVKIYRDADRWIGTVATAARVDYFGTDYVQGSIDINPAGWDTITSPVDGLDAGTHDLGIVPGWEFQCRPKLYGPVTPELSNTVLNTQDQINKAVFDALVTAEFQAFPQRVFLDIDGQVDAETGEPVNPGKAGPNRVWELKRAASDTSESPRSAVFQLDAADLKNHINLIEHKIKVLAAQGRTPLYALAGDLVNIGGDTIDALDKALIAKVKRHQRQVASQLVDVAYALQRLAGRPVDRSNIEIVWANPQLFTLQQMSDTAIKMYQAGYPFSAIARALGATDAEVDRLIRDRAAEQAALAADRQIITPNRT